MNTTNTTTTTTTNADIVAMLVSNVAQTRRYGSTYVKAAVRADVMGWKGASGHVNGREVKITFSGYGRSLQVGGHRYKAYANFADTGKPVPTTQLHTIKAL
jgi:hypothetical protein